MMTNERIRFILPINLTIAILSVSTASIFIRFAQTNTPSLVIAALRLTFATLLITPFALMRHRAELSTLTLKELTLGAGSGLFLAAHFAAWISSLEYTSVASSVVFVSTGPLWVALLSPVLLNEKLTHTVIIGLGLALFGGTVIGLSDACVLQNGLKCPQLSQVLQAAQGSAMWGNFLALAGAWAITGYLIIGRKLRAKMSLIPYIFLVYGIAAVVLVVLMFTAGQSPTGYPLKSYGWIFLLAAIPQLVGHSMFNWLLKYLSATMVAVTTLSEPIGSAVLAFIFLKESPASAVMLGGAFILIGIYLTSKQRN